MWHSCVASEMPLEGFWQEGAQIGLPILIGPSGSWVQNGPRVGAGTDVRLSVLLPEGRSHHGDAVLLDAQQNSQLKASHKESCLGQHSSSLMLSRTVASNVFETVFCDKPWGHSSEQVICNSSLRGASSLTPAHLSLLGNAWVLVLRLPMQWER